ncbi:hypothetical protein HGA91_02935 [candidate division WWE3 bacterium]|nr:hypothetical protein [candidate division WWE3 bacterium]
MEKIGATLKLKAQKFEDPDKNVSREFQIYGVELAERLGDSKHKALYIKLAKELPRDWLEKAYSFASDYPNAKSKAKIFMYKLKDIRKINETVEESETKPKNLALTSND